VIHFSKERSVHFLNHMVEEERGHDCHGQGIPFHVGNDLGDFLVFEPNHVLSIHFQKGMVSQKPCNDERSKVLVKQALLSDFSVSRSWSPVQDLPFRAAEDSLTMLMMRPSLNWNPIRSMESRTNVTVRSNGLYKRIIKILAAYGRLKTI